MISKLKNFDNFIKEDFETENVIDELNTETSIENDSETPIVYNEAPENGCKTVIINGCEPETKVSEKTSELKEKLNCDCEEIFLYQLNIQSVKKSEPKDGMEMIYTKIEEADSVIFACESKKGALSEDIKNVLDRLKNHYKEKELKNKIFGTLIIGKEDDKLKNELVLCAINDLNMIVGGDCVYVGDGETTDLTSMSLCLINLCNSTSTIRNSTISDNVDSEIKDFGEFVDLEQVEDPNEQALEDDLPLDDTEEQDEFVSALKGDIDNSFTEFDEDEEEYENELDLDGDGEVESLEDEIDGIEEESDSIEEEEESLIDNLDGTITHIHRGKKDTNSKKGGMNESKGIISFKDFKLK